MAADTITRLENWARVVRVTYRQQRSCGSLEGLYRSPQPWDEPVYGVQTPLTGAEIHDAWRVEAAWIALNHRPRLMLRAHYCWKAPKVVALRLLRRVIRAEPMPYEVELSLAHSAIEESLRRDVDQNHNIARNWAKKLLAIVSAPCSNEPQLYNLIPDESLRRRIA